MNAFKEKVKELASIIKTWYLTLPQPAKSITLFVSGVLVGGLLFG